MATVNAVATEAAADALRRGGNAVDAAVAAALTLGVVDGENSGIGGGCFVLLRLPNGKVVALDGREEAPADASREMFVRDGKAVPELSLTGALASGVPGELAALEWISRRYGRLPLADALRAAARVAEEGFVVTAHYAGRLHGEVATMAGFPEAAAIFLHPDGTPYREGERLRQPDLAATYRALADHGTRWFYRGEFAARVDQWMRGHGGVMRASDFRAYRVRSREPVRSTYRGYDIVGFPPPSSGGVHVAQILNLLENFDVRALGEDSADFAHLTTEAMRRAFADRAFWLGDPDFTPVPRGLTDKAYARSLAGSIRLDRAEPVPGHGTPPRADTDLFGKHTTHFSVADEQGYWVAVTATVNTTFGSKVVVPGTGVVLNNQMDDFTAQPGATNFFGLRGVEANTVAPGKRPLSSMSPTFVLKNGQPILAVGAAGGPTIISQTLLAVVRTIDFDDAPEAALRKPRFHHQWQPDRILLEEAWPESVAAALRARGHRVERTRALGATQAVGRVGTGDSAAWKAAADPRVEGRGTVVGVP